MSRENGRVPVFAAKCGTCVFHPGNRMRLAPGRLADLIATNLARGTALICHKTTHGQHPEIGETVCRGWFDAYRTQTTSLVVVERLAARDGVEPYEFPDPPERDAMHDRRCDRDLCHPDCPERKRRREDDHP